MPTPMQDYPDAEAPAPGSDPVMDAIRAKFLMDSGGGADGRTFTPGATHMPTSILPVNPPPVSREALQAMARRQVMSMNANAKPKAIQSQIVAAQQNPAIMDQLIAAHGQSVGIPKDISGYTSIQDDQNAINAQTPEQPLTIQQFSSALPPEAGEEAAEGVSDSPQEDAKEANGSSVAGKNGGNANTVKAPATQADSDAMYQMFIAAGLTTTAAAAAVYAATGNRPKMIADAARSMMPDKSPGAQVAREMNKNTNRTDMTTTPGQTSTRKAPIESAPAAAYTGGEPSKSALPPEAQINDMISEGGPITSTPQRPTEKTVSGAGKSNSNKGRRTMVASPPDTPMIRSMKKNKMKVTRTR